MDVLTDLLRRAEAAGTVFALSHVRAPWGLVLDDRLPLAVHVALEQPVWLGLDRTGEWFELAPGDLALVTAGWAHRLASDPSAPCATLADARRSRLPGTLASFQLGGDGAPGRLLCGAYRFHGDLCKEVVRSLPPVTVVRSGELDGLAELVELMAAETAGDRSGRSLVLDRLLDVLFTVVLRATLDRAGDRAPGWHRALADPDICRAIGLVHAAPERAWTLAEWARDAGLSRATFARRFHATVGVAPMTYLTRWRMELAAELLASTRQPIGHIGRRVGYANEAAFSAAFRRHHGIAPSEHRGRNPVTPGSHRARAS